MPEKAFDSAKDAPRGESARAEFSLSILSTAIYNAAREDRHVHSHTDFSFILSGYAVYERANLGTRQSSVWGVSFAPAARR
jgi:hypothetical protein